MLLNKFFLIIWKKVCEKEVFDSSTIFTMPCYILVKVSLSLVNGAFGANGDNEWRQWMVANGANGAKCSIHQT